MQMEHTLKIQKLSNTKIHSYKQTNKKTHNYQQANCAPANELIHKTKLLKLLHSTA